MSPRLTRDVTPPGDEPRSPLEQAADKALATLEHWLAADLLELEHALLIVSVRNLPEGRVQSIEFDGKAPEYAGLAIYGGAPGAVYVLGRVPTRELVEHILEGWPDVCGNPDSIAWVKRRLAAEA